MIQQVNPNVQWAFYQVDCFTTWKYNNNNLDLRNFDLRKYLDIRKYLDLRKIVAPTNLSNIWFKVWVFWEGHKIWKKSSLYFWQERCVLWVQQRTCQKVDDDFSKQTWSSCNTQTLRKKHFLTMFLADLINFSKLFFKMFVYLSDENFYKVSQKH